MATLSQRNNLNTLALAITTGLLTLALAGCGGGSDNTKKPKEHSLEHNDGQSGGHGHGDGQNTNAFTETATWTVNYNDAAKKPICYDFDSKTEVADCQGKKWDIKFDNQGTGGVKFWSNGGISGDGNGSVFHLMPASFLKSLTDATDETKTPKFGYKADSGKGIFSQNKWYAYNLNGNHQIYPNSNVYLINTDITNKSPISTINHPIYAVQIINFYKNDKPYNLDIRWIDTALPQAIKNITVNSNPNKNQQWVYLDLKNEKIVQKDDNWHMGFKGTDVILNSGISGNGKVGGYLAKAIDGYYKAKDGRMFPVREKFNKYNTAEGLKESKQALTDTANYNINDKIEWKIDEAGSQLNPPRKFIDKQTLDDGWYTYNTKNHQLSTKPKDKAIGALIRSGEGDSYAKMTLDNIDNITNDEGKRNSIWTFKFEVQPAKSK